MAGSGVGDIIDAGPALGRSAPLSVFLGSPGAPPLPEARLKATPQSITDLSHPGVWLLLAVSGLLVGFGTRYGGGCTSGHAITGLSTLQGPSLIATVSFFAGGILSANFLLPLLMAVIR